MNTAYHVNEMLAAFGWSNLAVTETYEPADNRTRWVVKSKEGSWSSMFYTNSDVDSESKLRAVASKAIDLYTSFCNNSPEGEEKQHKITALDS